MASINNGNIERPDYRTFTYDITGTRVIQTNVWLSKADFDAQTVSATRKILRIDYAYSDDCKEVSATFTYGRNLDSTSGAIVRRVITNTMTYDGFKVSSKDTTVS